MARKAEACVGWMLLALGAAEAVRAQGGRQLPPPATHLEALAADPARGRLVLFGGMRRADGGSWVEVGETWEWDDAAGWRTTVGADGGPGRRRAHAMAYDPGRRVVVLVGGVRERPGGGGEEMLHDAWRYDGRRWLPDGEAPALATPQLAYDPRRRALLLAGYRSDRPGARWLLLYRRQADEGWRLVDSAGPMTTGPLRIAYDARRSVLVVPALADSEPAVWEWDGGAWRRRAAAAGPSRRTRYGFAFDARAHRSVLVGGRGEAARDLLGDAWSWDGSRWTPLPAADSGPRPGPRASTTLLYDPARSRLALYGGLSSGELVSELWLLEAGEWKQGH
ncbi:MAG TPA: hypothetical protein VKA84_05300 [Gemmatimonadaceae bacterium]|nr:hypothetical protein [Gemmatimonadaceae bacterium]